ncbi:hypothetical protein CL656_05860 [bacterium]|nr:hypothetical protein [bacterium]|tara:strand:+ start:1927 stop:2298 length:372 start_codon:yes stop_codon:yes gene_type:complete
MKTLLIDAINCLLQKDIGINQDLLNELEKLKNPKIIVTNASQEKLENMGFKELPYEIFTCNGKPNKFKPEYFKNLLNSKNLKPEDCYYLDHKQENLDSAKKVGIEGYLYTEKSFSFKNFIEKI